MANLEKTESAVQPTVVAVAAHEPFVFELWWDFRPYAKCFIKDWLIGVLLYLLQYTFELLEKWLPLQGWSKTVVANEHAVGMMLIFALVVGLMVKDVLQIHWRQR